MGSHLRTNSSTPEPAGAKGETLWVDPMWMNTATAQTLSGKGGNRKETREYVPWRLTVCPLIYCASYYMNPNGGRRTRSFIKSSLLQHKENQKNRSGRTNGERLGQLNVWPESFYTCNTVVSFELKMYSQKNSTESPSRENNWLITLQPYDFVEIRCVVTWIGFSLAARHVLGCKPSLSDSRVEIFLVTENSSRQIAHFLHPFSPQTQSLIAHLLQDDLSLASTLKRNFLLPDCKIPKDASEFFIFSSKKCRAVNLSTKRIHRS